MSTAETSSGAQTARPRAYRRVNAAIHLLGVTAYAVPWLLALRGRTRIEAAAAVLLLGVGFAAWTARSRRPTAVSVVGAILTAAVIALGPALRATGRLDALLPITPQTAMTFALACAFGVAIARPSVRGSGYVRRPSLAAADRSGARAGAWLVLVTSPTLVLAAYRLQAAPRAPEAIFAVATAAAIVLFGMVVSTVGASRARGRKQWLAKVRRGEVPGYRLRPRMPSDPALVAFDDVASSRSSAVLEAFARTGLLAMGQPGRAVALAPIE